MFGSTLGQIGQPFFALFAWLLGAFYALIPNYAIAIALLTGVVMVAVFPITRRSIRGMLGVQLLAPELQKLQAKYKPSADATPAVRQELRLQLQTEQMALYRENGVSAAGGCLPGLLQFPIFIVLYGTVKGLVHQGGLPGHRVVDPLYLSHSSAIYRAIVAAHGQLMAFGVNLADSVRSTAISGETRVALIALVLAAVGLQYLQTRQANARASAVTNPQLQHVQRLLPIFLAVVYLSIPGAIVVYFVISGLFRLGQQEFMYRRDPRVLDAMQKVRSRLNPAP